MPIRRCSHGQRRHSSVGQATAPRHNAFHIIQQRRGGLRHVIKHRAALEMQLEAAVVHVHRADEARLPVGEGGLTVQQPRLRRCRSSRRALRARRSNTAPQDRQTCDPGCPASSAAHPRRCRRPGTARASLPRRWRDRRRDIDGLVCGGNQVQKRVLGGVDGVVVRPVAQRLAEARAVDMQLRTVVVRLLLE